MKQNGTVGKATILAVMILYMAFTVVAQDSYIEEHKMLAKFLSLTFGIPSSVILAVAYVESGAGRGEAAIILHNHFGIVGKNFLHKYDVKTRYKQYPNETMSYIDFCLLVSHKKYYRKLRYKMNSSLWIHAMSLAGYSELPEEWEEKTNTKIQKLHLPK